MTGLITWIPLPRVGTPYSPLPVTARAPNSATVINDAPLRIDTSRHIAAAVAAASLGLTGAALAGLKGLALGYLATPWAAGETMPQVARACASMGALQGGANGALLGLAWAYHHERAFRLLFEMAVMQGVGAGLGVVGGACGGVVDLARGVRTFETEQIVATRVGVWLGNVGAGTVSFVKRYAWRSCVSAPAEEHV